MVRAGQCILARKMAMCLVWLPLALWGGGIPVLVVYGLWSFDYLEEDDGWAVHNIVGLIVLIMVGIPCVCVASKAAYDDELGGAAVSLCCISPLVVYELWSFDYLEEGWWMAVILPGITITCVCALVCVNCIEAKRKQSKESERYSPIERAG